MCGRHRIQYRTLIWAVAVTETVHNLEEAIWLPGLSQTARLSVGAFEFRFAAMGVTLLTYAVVYYYWKSGSVLSRYLMAGALVGFLFNVLVPHLLVFLISGEYVAGVVSGVLLNAPVCVYLLRRGIVEGIYTAKMLVAGGLALILMTLPLIVLLFALGRLFLSIFG